MTKPKIAKEITNRTGIDTKVVLRVIDAFLDIVKESLIKGTRIYLQNFGVFTRKRKKDKVARNIYEGKQIVIPAYDRIVYKPDADLVEKVKQDSRK